MQFDTKVLHAVKKVCDKTGAIINPIYLSTTFVQEEPAKHKGYEYSRSGNPTRDILEKTIAALEEAQYGLAFSSGLAAADCVINLLQAGDHIICSDDVYAGTYRLFEKVKTRGNLSFSWVDMTHVENIRTVITSRTKMLWIETPTNPLLKLIDIEAVVNVAQEYGLLVVVDNTFMTPFFQKPLTLGADIVLHSMTKYLNGHSDVVGGALATNSIDLFEKLKFLQNAVGAVPSPFDCWLVTRGLKTLHVRMRQHEKNAQKVANFLQTHSLVKHVIYPGLISHPQHELAKKQMTGFGGMVSFVLDVDKEKVNIFLKNLKFFALAESLGCVESLIEVPAVMTHGSLPVEERKKLGITDGFIRLSVGIEDVEDLINDLGNALGVVEKCNGIYSCTAHGRFTASCGS